MVTSVPSVPVPGGSGSRGFSLRAFGRDITITKTNNPSLSEPSPSSTYSGWGGFGSFGTGGWFNIIQEPFTGAWQKNQSVSRESVLAQSTVYACITLIASDISKMQVCLKKKNQDGIWIDYNSSAFSPVLRKPNHYQTRIKFFEQWIVSKLTSGNTYVLKGRDDQRGIVTDMYVLDPNRTRPVVAPNGDVYYQLGTDNLTNIDGEILVPASEIIHDTMVPLYHPLVGVTPLYACGIAALQALEIQGASTRFFKNNSTPSGVLTAPGKISDETALRLKQHWEDNYTGKNAGRVAVLGDGLKYERMTMTAVESQLIEQLKWDAETVCSAFHVPAYMVGVGAQPPYNNIEALNQQYYSQCLQAIIESIECLLDEGLGLGVDNNKDLGTEFDLDGLLRMDTATQYKTYGDGITSGLLAPNEGRAKINLPKAKGGETPYLQQQNFSLAALAERDANNPFPDKAPPAAAPDTTAQPAPPVKPPAGAPAEPSKSFEDEEEYAEMFAMNFAYTNPIGPGDYATA